LYPCPFTDRDFLREVSRAEMRSISGARGRKKADLSDCDRTMAKMEMIFHFHPANAV